MGISQGDEIRFLEIGVDGNNVHLLLQSVPRYSPTKIVITVKSLIGRDIFKQATEVKKQLWGGEFWSDGYFVSTVGEYANEEVIGCI